MRQVRLRRRRPGRRGGALAALAVATAAATVTCSDSAPTATSSSAPEASSASDSGEAVSAQTLALGAALYSRNCQSCHGDREGSGNNRIAPLHNEQGHTFHHPDAQTEGLHPPRQAAGIDAGVRGKLTQQQVEAILSLIKTWWTPADLGVQRDISRRYQEALDKQQNAE